MTKKTRRYTKMLGNASVLLLVLAIVHVQCLPLAENNNQDHVEDQRLLEGLDKPNQDSFKQQSQQAELQGGHISKRHAQHPSKITERENLITKCLHGAHMETEEASTKAERYEPKRHILNQLPSRRFLPISRESQPLSLTVKDLIDQLVMALSKTESPKKPEAVYGAEKLEGRKNGTTFKYEMYEDGLNTDVLLHEIDERGNEIFLRVYGPSVIGENEDFTSYVTAYKNGNRVQSVVTRRNGYYYIKDYDYESIYRS